VATNLPPDILITNATDLLPVQETKAYAQGVAAGRYEQFVADVKAMCGFCEAGHKYLFANRIPVMIQGRLHHQGNNGNLWNCNASALRLANPDLSAKMDAAK